MDVINVKELRQPRNVGGLNLRNIEVCFEDREEILASDLLLFVSCVNSNECF
jgi:hypothetical protein